MQTKYRVKPRSRSQVTLLALLATGLALASILLSIATHNAGSSTQRLAERVNIVAFFRHVLAL